MRQLWKNDKDKEDGFDFSLRFLSYSGPVIPSHYTHMCPSGKRLHKKASEKNGANVKSADYSGYKAELLLFHSKSGLFL